MEKENYKKTNYDLTQDTILERLTKPELIKRMQYREKRVLMITGILFILTMAALFSLIFIAANDWNDLYESKKNLKLDLGAEICANNDLGQLFYVYDNTRGVIEVDCENGNIFVEKVYS